MGNQERPPFWVLMLPLAVLLGCYSPPKPIPVQIINGAGWQVRVTDCHDDKSIVAMYADEGLTEPMVQPYAIPSGQGAEFWTGGCVRVLVEPILRP